MHTIRGWIASVFIVAGVLVVGLGLVISPLSNDELRKVDLTRDLARRWD